MKNRKGFTIVELVIVIAVIAILAAVLIPTFSGVVENANKSAAVQEARAALTDVIAMSTTGEVTDGTAFVSDKFTFYYKNNKLDEANEGSIDTTPAVVFANDNYFALASDSKTVTGFKDKASAEKVLGAIGYNVSADPAKLAAYAFKEEGKAESKSDVVNVYTFKIGETDYYLYIPTVTIYKGTTDLTSIMNPGYAYICSTALSANFTTVGEVAKFQILQSQDMSKDVVVIAPNLSTNLS